MMINKRLIQSVSTSKKPIALTIFFQWISLLCNILIVFTSGFLIESTCNNTLTNNTIWISLLLISSGIMLRFLMTLHASKMSFKASEKVKIILREQIYRKLLRLNGHYKHHIESSALVQITVEGVEQLEIYFGKYLPQFFYSLLAPITLFILLSFINFPSALVLLLCVPLIPISIILVQKFAKKILAKYWNQYTTLGNSFLENLQGLTTLKIYQADEMKNQQMNEEAQYFRKITMKVLSMQLNSITLMDLVAYGGTAIGIIVSITQYLQGHLNFTGCFAIILLSAEFFIPLRLLGSFFHIAMNGMAATDKIFRFLDLPEDFPITETIDPSACAIIFEQVSFAYTPSLPLLSDLNLRFEQGKLSSIVGESGCGKSTLVALIMKEIKLDKGSIMIGQEKLTEINDCDLMKKITFVFNQNHLFKQSVSDHLRMGNPCADDQQLWQVLKKVRMDEFLKQQQGLATLIQENAVNLSGGQRQRLALARSLLHDTPIYIFDEATSNIDIESENDIMNIILDLAKTKTVILISHRLYNVKQSDFIYVLQKGKLVEQGNHDQLLAQTGTYATLWNTQQDLENYIPQETQYA